MALYEPLYPKVHYSEDDITTIEELKGDVLLQFFPDIPLNEEKGIMGVKSRWRCDCGMKNTDKEAVCACGRSRLGFFKREISPVAAQDIVNYKVELLRSIG